MARTTFQSGAERGHWHDALGVDRAITGEQAVRLLGPFHVAHDTPGLLDGASGGAFLCEITAGMRIIRAWAEIGEDDPFVQAQPGIFTVFLHLPDIGSVNLVRYADVTYSENFVEYFARVENYSDLALTAIATAVLDCQLRASLTNEATGGSADIYALIAEPT